ncbi:pantoate--beta-alanine ligase, partial [candidate division KSB1 bacterium]|nr:pantoate--beta-alanine ligase [candidate division KSB1 bacterium]
MIVIRSIPEMTKWAETQRLAGKKIALVPTMGYLHAGHLSLVHAARRQADCVVMSIYVNPAQFGPNEDFDRYPRDFERDKKLAADAGTDIIFAPSDSEMYASPHLTSVQVERLTAVLCGASRPTHFRGVTTVVAMLFNIVKPHIAVFGQKDAQQALVIQRMVADLHYDIQLIVAPILRENDGLAMSSRNRYLTPDQRRSAVALHRSLQNA